MTGKKKSSKSGSGSDSTVNAPAEAKSGEGFKGQESKGPEVRILAQYIKDLSFENPNAPKSFQNKTNPNINVNINVNAQTIGNGEFVISLQITAEAFCEKNILFNVELTYAGVFKIDGIPKEQLHPYLLIECPRILFPFARHVIFEATRDGGYPPLMLDPIDFTKLYKKKMFNVSNENNKDRTIN